MNYSLKKIAQITGGQLIGPGGGTVKQILTDSRGVFQASESLFIALTGPNHDGHDYIPDLLKRGIKAYIVDQKFNGRIEDTSGNFIIVQNTLYALQDLAAWHRKSFTGKVIGVTGSNGKTVVKEWLSQVLTSFEIVSKNPKSYNSQVGVPLSVLMMDPGPQYHISEAGISLPGEMENLEKIICPDIGILTNLGEAHQENFETYEAKLLEKLKLFKNSALVIYCKDALIIKDKIRELYGKGKMISFTWGVDKEADLRILEQSEEEGQTLIRAGYKSGDIIIRIPFTDKASVENIMHIWAFCVYHNYPEKKVQEAISALEPVAMRMEQKEGIRGCTLINDFYNSDLNSLDISLDLLVNQLPQEKKTLILSELLQTGLSEEELIKRVSGLLDEKKLFRVIGIGEFFIRNISNFSFTLNAYRTTEEFLEVFPFATLADEAILLKGARKFKFEKISRQIEQRSHNTVVEVRMNNLLHNLNVFRSRIAPGTMIMAMVKASSYGSGNHEIAKFLAHQRVDYLGVAYADEGVSLREAGVEIPIMVMNPEISGFDKIIDNRLEPEMYSNNTIREFREAVKKAGLKHYPIHIKIDTGMHRLGFHPDETDTLIKILSESGELKIKSIFSHFSSADLPENDAFTHAQADLLIKTTSIVQAALGGSFISHISNTSGIIRFPEYNFDMVRIGIGLYGVDDDAGIGLKPVLGMKTIISQVHNLKKGESVGYGNSQKMKQNGRIAVIPIGYADGLDRKLGNGTGSFVCNGEVVKTIGKICMDMCMIDISGISADAGDEVEIFGEKSTISKMAYDLKTITYEILARIPQRVKRVYHFD